MRLPDSLWTQIVPQVTQIDNDLVQPHDLLGRLVVQHLHFCKEERELFAEDDGGRIECAVSSVLFPSLGQCSTAASKSSSAPLPLYPLPYPTIAFSLLPSCTVASACLAL